MYIFIYLGSYNKKLKVKQLSKHFLNLIQTEFPQGFLLYYMNPTDTSLNNENTSTQYLTQRYLPRTMLSFYYNTNINMINNVLNTPLSKGIKDKDVLTVITGLSGGKARVIEELKMKMNAEINNNTLAVSITYSLDWSMVSLELDKFERELYPDAAECEERMVSVGMVFTVINRLARMLYRSRYEWLDRLSINKLSKVPMADFHLVLIAFIQAVVDDMRQRGGRPIDKFVLLIDGGHKPYEVLQFSKVKIPDLWRAVVKALTGPEIERYTGIKTALVITALPWFDVAYAGEGQKCRTLVTPAVLDSAEIVEHIWLPQLQQAYHPLPPTGVARLELLAATCAQMVGTIHEVGDKLLEWLNKGESLESVLSGELMTRLDRRNTLWRHKCETPSHTIMHHLLYNRPITIDSDVEYYLLKSYFTNTIEGGVVEGASIVPDACVLVMAYVANITEKYGEYKGKYRERVCYRQPILSIFDCCRDPSLAYGGDGGLVQSIVSNVFKVKMLVDLYCVDVPTTLAGLFGLQGDSSVNMSTASSEALATFAGAHRLDSPLPKKRCHKYDPNPFSSRYNDGKVCDGHLVVVPLPSYDSGRRGFYEALANTSDLPTAATPYVILLPSTTTSGGGVTGDVSAYDLVIACYAGPDEPPYIVFISTGRAPAPAASDDAVAAPSESTIPSESIPEWHIPHHCTRTQLADTALPSRIFPTGLLGHIRAGKWMHIHLSSDPEYTQTTVVADNCLVLGPAQVEKLMGPFREVYKAALRYGRHQ